MSKKDWFWFSGLLLGIMGGLSTGLWITAFLCVTSLASMVMSFFADDLPSIEITLVDEVSPNQRKVMAELEELLAILRTQIAAQEKQQ